MPRRARRCINISEPPAATSASPIAIDQRRSKPVNGSDLLAFEGVSAFAATPLDELLELEELEELELLEELSFDGDVPLEGVVGVVGVVVVVVVGVVL
jgi:hypothetical protein